MISLKEELKNKENQEKKINEHIFHDINAIQKLKDKVSQIDKKTKIKSRQLNAYEQDKHKLLIEINIKKSMFNEMENKIHNVDKELREIKEQKDDAGRNLENIKEQLE